MKLSVSKKKIIGITGAFGSGKTTASQFFESKGYTVIGLSSFLEEEAIKRKLPLTRKILQDLGNELRGEFGAGILVKKALGNLHNKERVVIDGLRNLSEIEELKKEPGSVVIAIVADKNIRFDRLKKLKRREKLTRALFNKLDLRDLGVNEKISGLQTAFCIAVADVYIDSNSTMNNFKAKLDDFINKYGN